MKDKIIPVVAVLSLIFIILVSIIVGKKIKQYVPNSEEQNLEEYFGITADDEIAIELNHSIIEEKALLRNGEIYLDYNYVHDYLNDRFYWDTNENILLYTTSSDVIKAFADSKDFYTGRKKDSKSYKIVLVDVDKTYIALDYVAQYTDMEYEYIEEPGRVLVQTEWGTVKKVSVKRKTQLRVKNSVKSKILKELGKDETLIKLDSGKEWTKAATPDGLIGYVQNKRLGAETKETQAHEFEEQTFTHEMRDYEICMAWHQVTVPEANNNIVSVLQNTKGINVISPTWFYLNDNDGNIANLASADYVKYCHDKGIEVWGLVSNLENQEVSTTEVLTHTSKRENLENQIIAAAIQYDLDGINVDFEALEAAVGEGFIQFIRELSLKCDGNGIVLSVDNYVSSEYTKFYDREEQAVFADYLIVMAYDEHYAGSKESGSVASIGFVTKGADDILAENVPSEQVILGMPFYTRVWAEKPKESDGDDAESASDDYVPYELSSEACGMLSAQRLMEVNGAEKTWLEDMGQYYTEYVNNNITYKIWFEDVRSIEEKLKVMDSHEFAGAAFWKLGLEDSTVWDTVIKYIN
ncbi:MAG: glycosyl hydrolase family 18 [Eubacterium sp.]|jgi:spore germination protein YaaH|nr:glycosyl hydrolase family 18 [Eubacterium sp.]